MKEIFEIVRRNLERVFQDQARHLCLRRRQWKPKIGDVVLVKEHHLSKAAEGFAVKLALRFDGSYQIVDFVSPVIWKVRLRKDRKEGTVNIKDLSQRIRWRRMSRTRTRIQREEMGKVCNRTNSTCEWTEQVIC